MSTNNVYSKKLNVTTAGANHIVAGNRGGMIYNSGAVDVQVGFDKAIDSDSTLIPAGATLEFTAEVRTLYFDVASSSADVYISLLNNP